MTIQELKANHNDIPAYHQMIHDTFCQNVNNDLVLKNHRDYIEINQFGFGERSFQWAWKLIMQELPENPKLLEIGVYKAQTLSLWKLLRPDAQVFGVSPLDDSGFEWSHEDGFYAAAIKHIHDHFELEYPTIFKGKSSEVNVVKQAFGKYDVVYIDGDHSFEGCLFDLHTYAEMVKVGGYLVIDDCACDFSQPFGFFQGIGSVQASFDEWSKTTDDFEFQFNVVHLRILKRTK